MPYSMRGKGPDSLEIRTLLAVLFFICIASDDIFSSRFWICLHTSAAIVTVTTGYFCSVKADSIAFAEMLNCASNILHYAGSVMPQSDALLLGQSVCTAESRVGDLDERLMGLDSAADGVRDDIPTFRSAEDAIFDGFGHWG